MSKLSAPWVLAIVVLTVGLAACGETAFYVFNRSDMPSVETEVVLWGEDAGLELRQERLGAEPVVRTTAIRDEFMVEVDVFPAVVDGTLVTGVTARVRVLAPAPRPMRVGSAIRPANPEGAAPVFQLERTEEVGAFLITGLALR